MGEEGNIVIEEMYGEEDDGEEKKGKKEKKQSK